VKNTSSSASSASASSSASSASASSSASSFLHFQLWQAAFGIRFCLRRRCLRLPAAFAEEQIAAIRAGVSVFNIGSLYFVKTSGLKEQR